METSTNKILISNYSDNNEKNRKAIDKIILQILTPACLRIFFIILAILMPFEIFLLWFVPYRRVIIIDEVKAAIIIAVEKICYSCNCSCCIKNEKIYYLSQIKKVKIYLSSIPDPQIGFHKKYFINCDVFSIDNALESLFSNVEYSKERIDEFISFFQRYLNPDIITLEVDMGDINENNTSYPLLNGDNQTPNQPSIDESM